MSTDTGVQKPGKKSLLEEILCWSEQRPKWQRDALRRLFRSPSTGLSPVDFDELYELMKLENHFLIAEELEAVP